MSVLRYESAANIEFNYLSTRDGVKTMSLNANIDKSNMEGNLQVHNMGPHTHV